MSSQLFFLSEWLLNNSVRVVPLQGIITGDKDKGELEPNMCELFSDHVLSVAHFNAAKWNELTHESTLCQVLWLFIVLKYVHARFQLINSRITWHGYSYRQCHPLATSIFSVKTKTKKYKTNWIRTEVSKLFSDLQPCVLTIRPCIWNSLVIQVMTGFK